MTSVESDYYAFMQFDPVAMKQGRSHYVQFFDAGPVLELACGRGEFLELLAEAGIEARGVDIDPGMVAASRAAGHDVALGDALQALVEVPDGSLRGLFCAHFLEHLRSEQVEQVYLAAARVLAPGGSFVAVVPNLGSLSVLSYDFWRDPTHVRPYDPMLLEFFARHADLNVVESGGNPLVDPGPPPHLWPIEPEPVLRVPEHVSGLVDVVRARHRRSIRNLVRRLVGRTRKGDESVEPWLRVEQAIAQLDTSLQSVQHHLYDLRSAYVKALKQLYPPNEVFVVAKKGPASGSHG
jgi:SAM-dependent methyltransferase